MLARFRAAALGIRAGAAPGGFATRDGWPTDRSLPLATRPSESMPKPGGFTDLGATCTGAPSADGLDHCAVGMKDPEGNEFDIN